VDVGGSKPPASSLRTMRSSNLLHEQKQHEADSAGSHPRSVEFVHLVEAKWN
jgi:hypothetical protein